MLSPPLHSQAHLGRHWESYLGFMVMLRGCCFVTVRQHPPSYSIHVGTCACMAAMADLRSEGSCYPAC